jgi:inhibitor of KinA sporulation pathway (predicted exonuclease)
MKSKPQKYDYILVLDFEATCLKDMKIDPQEIIEYPCIILETRTYAIKDVFHHYVKPVKKPRLSPFCTKLTGITQRMVDESKTFAEVFDQFKEWVADETRENKKFVLATCGDWDLQTMLPAQLRLEGRPLEQEPDYLKTWINVKKVFEEQTQTEISKERNDLQQMMEVLGLRAAGSLHSGIDDVKNIARVVEVLSRFTALEVTSKLW